MDRSEIFEKYINTYTILAFFACLKIAIHLVFPEYGFARDELYYLTISENFSFDNLEILPVTPLYLKLITLIFGVSIKSIHFASALCGAGAIVFAGLMAKELGGGKSAIALTALTVLLSGFLIFGSFMSYDSIDFLLWSAGLYTLICIIKYDKTKLWIVFGLIIGIGLLNKLTIVLFGAVVFISLFTGNQRKHFKSIHIWIGGIIAFLGLIPFILWQVRTDWYYLDFAQNYSGNVSSLLSFPEYVWGQFLPNNLFNAFIWLPGLFALLFVNQFKQYKFLGFAYLILFFGCYFIGTKFYFIMPFYTVLLAAGSIQIIKFLNKKGKRKISNTYLKSGFIIGYLLLSFILIPHMMPILKVESFVKYAKYFGVNAGIKYEDSEINELPQHFADRFGWEEMTDTISCSFNDVTRRTGIEPGIITGNWGQASAIYIHGIEKNLPMPISLEGWFYTNTITKHSFKSDYITIGIDSSNLANMFGEINKLAHYSNRYCMPYENHKTLYHCSKPKVNLKNYWITAKSPDKEFVRLLDQESVKSAKEYYYQQKAYSKDTLLFTEAQLNTIGYDHLNKGDTKKALKIFAFNMDIYPESANVYDSYAEALMVSEKYEQAIEFYYKSLDLNPNNSNARTMLDRISEIQSR